MRKSSATKTQRHKKSMKYQLLSKKEEFIAEKIAYAASIELYFNFCGLVPQWLNYYQIANIKQLV